MIYIIVMNKKFEINFIKNIYNNRFVLLVTYIIYLYIKLAKSKN